MVLHGVLTGDIVNSTKLEAGQEKALIKMLEEVLSPYKYEFYRGDSFQAYIKQPNEALKIALLCRTAAISLAQNEEEVIFDVRISIGIGQITNPVKSLGAAKGEAFLLSGRAFDEITKTGTRVSITVTQPLANEGLQVIADYTNAIFRGMTGKQAAVIFELLKGDTQQAVAEKLKKSKSTINQHVSSGRWSEIENLLMRYEKIVNQLT